MTILTHSKCSSSSNVMFRNSVARWVLSYTLYARHLIPYILHMTHKEFHWKYLLRQRDHIYLGFQSTNMFRQGRVSSLLQSGDSSTVWACEGGMKFSGQRAWWSLQMLKDCLDSVQMPSLTITNIKSCPLSQVMLPWNTVPLPPLDFKLQKARNTNN